MTDTQTEPTDLSLAELAAMPVPIHVALSRVMGDVQGIGKHGRNEAQGFSFRGIDAVTNAVGPAFRKHGVICLPTVLEERAEDYTTRNGAVMHRVTLRMLFTFVGPDGSTLECSTLGEAADSGDKSVTKAHSVAYRTALLQALCIPTDEPDPDAEVHERVVEETPTPVLAMLRARLSRVNANLDAKAELAAWAGEAHLPPVTNLAPGQVSQLSAKLGDLETSFGLLAEGPGGEAIDAKERDAAPIGSPQTENRPESVPDPVPPPPVPGKPAGPQEAKEDPIRALRYAFQQGPPSGDVAGWLIAEGESLTGATLRAWFKAEGEPMPAGVISDQRRAWALAVHDRIAVATVRVLSGFGLSAEACEAVER